MLPVCVLPVCVILYSYDYYLGHANTSLIVLYVGSAIGPPFNRRSIIRYLFQNFREKMLPITWQCGNAHNRVH